MLMTSGGGGSPSSQVVSILKPAALAYLEIESNLPKEETGSALAYKLDRSALEFEFELSQKSYTLSINAMQALAANRPAFFKEVSFCISRRAVQPPVFLETGALSKSAVIAITSQLKSTCLAMLRNSLSITTKASDVLHSALKTYDMEIQADKALSMAKQATDLKTAGRAARNRANMYYEWDASDNDRSSRRQRETDDALAKMRAAKAARGLGHGIQLPTSMSDSIDLIMVNLNNLPGEPPKRSTIASAKIPISLDYIVDAIMTNGASLSHEEGHWYERDGSAAWNVDIESDDKYSLKENFVELLRLNFESSGQQEQDEREKKRRKIVHDQIDLAASNALGRILTSVTNFGSKSLGSLAGQLTSRLSFVLKNIQPSVAQEEQFNMAKEGISKMQGRYFGEETALSLMRFIEVHPLVASSLAADVMPTSDNNGVTTSIGQALLSEAFMQCCDDTKAESKWWKYDCTLALYVSLVVYAGEVANQKPTDEGRKKAAADACRKLQVVMTSLPRVTETSVTLLAGLCDLEYISKRVVSAQRQTSQEAIAVAAATHAAKQAAEKRAKCGLLILRDLACQKTSTDIRKWAVNCAAAIASGRLPSNPKVQENGLGLVVNVLFTKNESLSEFVANAAKDELRYASNKAIECYDQIEKANKEAEPKVFAAAKKNPYIALSSIEKELLEQMRGPALLVMAICLRIPEMIEDLFALSSLDKADVLSKAVRTNMFKLSKASAAKHGKTEIALKVAKMTGPNEVSLLLTFLENLASLSDRNNPDQDVIDVCYEIQELKKADGGEKDPRFVVPVVGYMLRKDLETRLVDFVAADDKVFMTALARMGERLNAQALLFREEQDEENPALRGMTLCEQLVFLHKLDFSSLDLPQQQKQRRYLSALKLCLEEEEIYNDSVVMSALDHISGTFLTRGEKLPLAFMRTCILVCSQHESLHSWICNELLPRLLDGKIYEDPRQWEGWMRCAHMLENSGQSGVSSMSAIAKLPPEQLMQYRTKWASSSGV
jgi:symplekin